MLHRKKGACFHNRDLVLKMDRDGATLSEIGRAVGTTRHRVRDFLRREGVTRKFPYSRKAEKSNQWKGGRIVDQDGYVLVYCPGHPGARGPDKRYVLEHRLVMEKKMGRYLEEGEVVHHRNRNKADNRIQNLELFSSNADHLKSELSGHVPKWTADGLARIRAGSRRNKARARSGIPGQSKPGDAQSP
jgi:hypothetical protein